MTVMCESFLFSRQNFYKTYCHCDPEKLNRSGTLKSAILSALEEHPGISGARLRQVLSERGLLIGRDRFYKLVNDYRLTLNSRKKAWRRNSIKVSAATNKIMNRTFRRVFEVLFSDYTEISTSEGKLQLLLVQDLISRFITAYRFSPTCTSAPVLSAIRESLDLKSSLKLRYPTIFHSDRGSEFVNHAVRALTDSNNVLVSNTGIHRYYENPFMESLNKTLKHSLGLRVVYPSKAEARESIESAINTYNFERQHSKLGYLTPYSVLTGYTGKNNHKQGEKSNLCHPAGRMARSYSKSLKVKIKKIKIDKPAKPKL